MFIELNPQITCFQPAKAVVTKTSNDSLFLHDPFPQPAWLYRIAFCHAPILQVSANNVLNFVNQYTNFQTKVKQKLPTAQEKSTRLIASGAFSRNEKKQNYNQNKGTIFPPPFVKGDRGGFSSAGF